jgi:hypothetical protein
MVGELSRRRYQTARIFAGIALVSLAVATATVWSGLKLAYPENTPDYRKLQERIEDIRRINMDPSSRPVWSEIAEELRKAAAKQEEAKKTTWSEVVAIVSCIGVVIGAIGTSSTMLLGWRAEKRQSEEFKLKIQQLERELAKSKEQDAPKRLDTAL